MKKQKIWYLTQQNLGDEVKVFDVWDENPRKDKKWKPEWKVFVMKEIEIGKEK